MDRRKIMVTSQAAMVLAAVTLTLLIFAGLIQIWHVYVSAFVTGVTFSINNPSRQSMVYDLVGRRDLPNAIALNSLSTNSARVIGPSLGGALLPTIGVDGTFLVQAACLLAAACATLMIKGGRLPEERREQVSFRESVIGGFQYVRKDRTMALLFVTALAAAMLGWPFISLMPAYAAEVLHRGSGGFGLTMAAVGAGAMAGAFFVASTRDIRWKGKLLLLAVTANGVGLIALGLSSMLAVSAALLVVIGLATAAHMSMNQTLMQLNVQDQYRGRVSALYLLTFGLQPIGALPAGFIAEHWGVRAGIFALGVALTLVIVVLALADKRLQKLR